MYLLVKYGNGYQIASNPAGREHGGIQIQYSVVHHARHSTSDGYKVTDARCDELVYVGDVNDVGDNVVHNDTFYVDVVCYDGVKNVGENYGSISDDYTVGYVVGHRDVVYNVVVVCDQCEIGIVVVIGYLVEVRDVVDIGHDNRVRILNDVGYVNQVGVIIEIVVGRIERQIIAWVHRGVVCYDVRYYCYRIVCDVERIGDEVRHHHTTYNVCDVVCYAYEIRVIVVIGYCGAGAIYGVGKIIGHIRGASYDVVDGQKVVGDVYSVADNGIARNIRKLVRNKGKIGDNRDVGIRYVAALKIIGDVDDVGAVSAAASRPVRDAHIQIPIVEVVGPCHEIGGGRHVPDIQIGRHVP